MCVNGKPNPGLLVYETGQLCRQVPVSWRNISLSSRLKYGGYRIGLIIGTCFKVVTKPKRESKNMEPI
jgi:hypothetical protein